MARISGVDLPREKRLDIGLTYVYGIGRAAARAILEKAGVDGSVRVKDVSEDAIVKIREGSCPRQRRRRNARPFAQLQNTRRALA